MKKNVNRFIADDLELFSFNKQVKGYTKTDFAYNTKHGLYSLQKKKILLTQRNSPNTRKFYKTKKILLTEENSANRRNFC